MRKNLFIFLLMPLIMVLAGCRKNSFKIEFSLDQDVWGNYQLSYYASDSKHGEWITATVPIQNGKFIFSGVTANPTIVYITQSSIAEAALYVKPGQKITITGKGSDPRLWLMEGNDVDKAWSSWRAEVYKEGRDKVSSKEIACFVKAHPDDCLSALMLLIDFPRNEDPEEFVRLWNTLGEKAKGPEMAMMAGSADFGPGALFEMNSNGRVRYDVSRRLVKSLALRRRGGYADTLKFTPGAPALLYFYKRGNATQDEIADSLKKIRKAFPDSTKAHIATVSLDPDSANWQSAVAHDSIPKVLDSWMPVGVSDKRGRLLGIGRTPWFVVIGQGGKQIYRGNDHKEASAVFRKALERSLTTK